MSLSHRLSRERRSSSRKSTNSTSSSFDLSRRNELPEWVFEETQRVIDKQEKDSIIYSIREDLMSRVMNVCYQNYLEKQTVKFMAHCTVKAFAQLLNMAFFNHDLGKPYYYNHPCYTGDKAITPSPPDSWAAYTAPIKLKPQLPIAEVFTDDLDVCSVVTDNYENVFQDSPLNNQSEIQVLYQSPSLEAPEPSTIEVIEVKTLSDLIVPNASEISIEEETMSDTPKSSESIFTMTTQMLPETLPHSMKSGRSKIKGYDFSSQNYRQYASVDSYTYIPKFNETSLSPLRKDIIYTKVKPPVIETNEDLSIPTTTKTSTTKKK